MNDQQFHETKDRIQTIFNSLTRALNLDKVRWQLVFVRDRTECHDDGASTVADIHPNWSYAAGAIQFYVWAFESLDDDEVAFVLLHELVHYWIHPISKYGLSKEADALEERVCTEVAEGIKSAIEQAGREVADHYKLEIKRLNKELKTLQKEIEELKKEAA